MTDEQFKQLKDLLTKIADNTYTTHDTDEIFERLENIEKFVRTIGHDLDEIRKIINK